VNKNNHTDPKIVAIIAGGRCSEVTLNKKVKTLSRGDGRELARGHYSKVISVTSFSIFLEQF